MENLYERYPCLSDIGESIENAVKILIETFVSGGKLLLCGNGGSCADCDHISGELLKSFLKKRRLNEEKIREMKKRCPSLSEDTLSKLEGGLPAISLPSLSALITAYMNDAEPRLVFAQEVMALGREGDVFLGISTSGNSENVVEAAKVAKGLGLTVIALTGRDGGRLSAFADLTVKAPETETYKVQELHLPIYHYICARVEEHFFE